MAEQTFDKKDVALAQVETALRLYFERQDYFSVITLAGAAEEIFGKLLSAKGMDNSLESHKKAVVALLKVLDKPMLAPKDIADRANRARNALKHQAVGGSPIVSLDVKQEAEDMLHRAILNYFQLEQCLTLEMHRFHDEATAT